MTKRKTDNRRREVQQIGEDSYTDYLAKQAAELDKCSFSTKGLPPGQLQTLALRHPGWNYPESAIKELLKSDKRLLSVRARESEGEIILSACILPTHPDLTLRPLTANQTKLSREATTRSEAVQQVWHLYQLYKAAKHKSQINEYWHYENALADVEVQLRKNVAENHASIRGVLAALLLWRWVSSAENKRAEAAALGDHPYKSTLPISLQWGEISLLDGPNQFTERLNDLVEYLAICKLSMRERWKEINKTIKAGVRVGDEILLETLETTPSRGDNEDTEEPRSSEQWLITLAPLYVKMTEVNQAYLFNEMQRISELPFETADDHLSALEAFDAAFDDSGDAYHGIFSTPSNIARLAVALSKPKPGERIYDPCFGSGNFLIEANRQVEKNQEYPRQHKNMLDISGVEINQESYLVGLVRMLLSGINTPHLKLGNSLEIDEPSSTEQQGFDLVIANPPINAKPISKAEAVLLTAEANKLAKAVMLADAETIGKLEKLFETESFLPPRFEFPTHFTDGLFIQHALSQLKPNGRAVIIVPEGFLSRGGADRDLRRNLLERGHIEAVVGLPAGSFAPHTRVKGSLLLLRKSGGLKSVRMADSTSLFYSKTRARAPVLLVTTAKQLAATITHQVLHEPQDLMPNADEEAFSAGEISRAVWEISVADLSKTDWDLTPRRREPGGLEDLLENLGNCGQITPLSNVVKVIAGRFIKLIDLLNKPESDGPSVGYIRIKELNNGRLSKPSTWLKPSSSETERRWALRKGDILLSKSMAIGKTAIVHEGATGYLAANSLYVLRADQERLDPEFLLAYIASAPCTTWLMSRSSGAASQHINSATLETLMIPLPTLPMQAQAAEQYRDFGTDVLTFLKGGSRKKDDERLTGWLDRLESRIPRFIAGAQETPQLSEFEFIARIAHEARNWAIHDMFNDSTARWLLPFSQALIPLSGISQIPPGPGLLSVLQEAERGLLHAIPNILGPLPAEAHVRSIAERLREWLRSAITDLVDSAAIELHSAPSSLTAGSVAEFTIELENRGSLPLRNLLVEASPSWGSAEVPYLAERSVMPINLHGNVQKNSGLVTFKLKWHALTLSGQRAKGTVEFAIRVVEPDVPISKIEEDFGGSPYVCGSPLEPRYGHEVFFGREGLIEQISRQIAT